MAAAADAGLAGISYVESVGVDAARWPAERARLESVLAAAPPGRTVGISPHTPYTLGTGVLAELSRFARERGLRLHPHLGESADEDEFVRRGTGPLAVGSRRMGRDLELVGVGFGASPTAYLNSVGCLGPDVHVAHGVHLDAADRALLRQRGTAVALCVRSNVTLGIGHPPVAAYLAEGSPVAVGTDSLASVGSLDLLDELRALRDLALAQGVAADGLPERLLRLATRGGAAAMGLADVGRLVPGARADLAGFSVSGSPADPFTALVESGRCVLTVVAGVPVAGVSLGAASAGRGSREPRAGGRTAAGSDRASLDRANRASLDRAGLDKAPGDVARMFDHVAPRYDITNTVLSLGQDRRWRRRRARRAGSAPGAARARSRRRNRDVRVGLRPVGGRRRGLRLLPGDACGGASEGSVEPARRCIWSPATACGCPSPTARSTG